MYEALAPIYDRVFHDESFYRRYGSFVRRVCRSYGVRPRRTLDVACGTGRLARHLPGKVDGVDASREMVRIASKRMNARRAPMTRFRADEPYDLIVCTFDSLNHLPPDRLAAAFACVRRALAEGGLYIFDLNSDFHINQVCPAFLGRQFRAGGREVFWIGRWRPNVWECRITIFEPRGRLWKRSQERIVEHAFTRPQVHAALKRAGLKGLAEYGDFKGGPVEPTSERWFFVAGHGSGN